MTQSTGNRYDVVVVGGGAAGVAAAVGAANEGARTLLIERYGFLGGAATNANVLAYCGFWTQRDTPLMGVRGVGEEVLVALERLGVDVAPHRTASENWIVALDPEAVKVALDQVVNRPGLDCLLHTRVIGARGANGCLEAVVVTDHSGAREIAATAFVDASGQADLVAAAAGALDVPDDTERQPASIPIRFGGVPASVIVDRDAVRSAIFRMGNAGSGLNIRSDGGLFFRLPLSGDLWWLGIDLLTDGLTGTSLTRSEAAGRDAAWRALRAFRDHVPGFENAYISGSGPQLGIRAARTAVPRHRIATGPMLAGQRRPDGVACGCWPAEVHHGLSGVTYDRIGADGYYHIPLDALRSASIGNVWLAGRVVGCEPMVYGSLRVMGTAFATGHAAGVAASCAARTGDTVEAASVRAALLRQGAFI